MTLEKPTTIKDWAAVDSAVAATQDYALATNVEADLAHTKKPMTLNLMCTTAY